MAAPGSGPSTRARLGSFEVDLRSGELRSLEPSAPSSPLLLREQPFQILRMLIERNGKIVTRAEIKKALWPNDTIVDFDRGINAAIVLLRRALGDSAANPRYIETLGRRGYRLLTGVEWAPRTGPENPADTAAALPPATELPRLADLLGKKVSHYRVVAVLGGGGMGMVYRA
ncbi:MAG TPA: winged helix-turn-helix domain-containing protein, partial [Myxococcaceae bacterium]|nr:winged helix-turn-helix domain-containing protein [Myxococcaceae bacterium]